MVPLENYRVRCMSMGFLMNVGDSSCQLNFLQLLTYAIAKLL